MKAAVWTKKDRIELRETPRPEPAGPNEAVVKIHGCGVCGTDVHIYKGEVPLAKPPVVLGHEIAGEVAELGSGVTDLEVGDFVCVDPLISCQQCEYCQKGRPNLCADLTIIGYVRDGGFAQYTSVPRSHLYRLSPEAGAKGGILVETLACVLNGYDRLGLEAGSDVLILGAGCVGLLWSQLVKHSVTCRLFQTEIVESRRRAAGDLGADVTINPRKSDLARAVRRHAPDGVEYIVDATGSAAAIQEALPLLKKGGTLMIFGVCPAEERLSLSPFDMFNNEWKVIAGKMPPHRMGRAARIVEAGIIDSERLVSRVAPLGKMARALKDFTDAKSRAIKIMIDPWA